MRRLLLCLCLLWPALSHSATTRIYGIVTITNTPADSNTFTLNSDVRYWVTNVITSPTNQIPSTNVVGWAATNLYSHGRDYPFSRVTAQPTNGAIVYFVAEPGVALTISVSAGYATVAYKTNTVATSETVVMPFTVQTGDSRTNIASGLVRAINANSTNAFDQSIIALSNYVSLSATQTTGNKTITNSISDGNRITNAIGINGTVTRLTNGYFTNAILGSPKITNGANYGTAFSSMGSSNFSEQFGALATSTYDEATALGYSANASAFGSTAVGATAAASGTLSTALGIGAQASGGLSTALGGVAVATKTNAVAIGVNATAAHTNSIAIGVGAATTAANQIKLGDSTYATSIPGSLSVNGTTNAFAGFTATNGTIYTAVISNSTIYASTLAATNATLVNGYGTNRMLDTGFGTNMTLKAKTTVNALMLSRLETTSLADGNNISVPLGSNSFMRVSGTFTTNASICGIVGAATSGGAAGQILRIVNAVGSNTVTLTQNTVDPVAANRLITGFAGADIVLSNTFSAVLIYDDASSRWRVIGKFP